MELWKAFILGLVQGFTEFLPVSSSGHLVLFQQWLGIEDGNILFFDTMLHLATLIAVCVVLYKEIAWMFKNILSKPVLFLIIATIPAGIVGITLDDKVEGFFGGTKYLWIFFIISAIILFISDYMGKKNAQKIVHNPEETKVGTTALFDTLNYGNILAMGVAQAFAVFPGITRSGSTIAAGVIAKGDREQVAKFSFLMSIPIILAAVLLQSVKMGTSGEPLNIDAGAIIVGMISAFVSGFIAVKWMLKLVAKCQLKWFGVYLLIMALVVVILNNVA